MKKDIKSVLLYVLIIVVAIAIIIGIINHFNNDGMQQTKGVSIYYKTYTDEDGWSKWSKNGMTSGDQIHPIKNIKIKFNKKREKHDVTYKISSGNEISPNIYDFSEFKLDKLYYFSISTVNRKSFALYDVCYRTYNKKNKWLDWSCDGELNGSDMQEMSAIEIKVIPKNVLKNEYLKDYLDNENNNFINGGK